MKCACVVLAAVGLLMTASPLLAQGQLEFRHEGVTALVNGNYEHTYSIIHNDSLHAATPIWDVDINYDYAHGWVNVIMPDPDWNVAHTDPRWWVFATDEADKSVEYTETLTGIKIEAGTPMLGAFDVSFTTGSTHQVFATNTAMLPLPEPASALLLLGGLGFLRRRR